MDVEKELEEDLKLFQAAVERLSSAINKSGIEWKDEQFKSLSLNIKNIAKKSKSVLVSGIESEDAIQRFRRIERER